MLDLDFISGRFFEYDVPKEQRYLLQYFKTDLQLAFLKYYMVFGNHLNFVDHTGYYCSRRLLFKLQARYRHLIVIYQKAKTSLTEEGMETIHLLEMGKFPLTGK